MPGGASRPGTGAVQPHTNWLWAELMQRSFDFDVLACPRCGDRLELVALIEDPAVIVNGVVEVSGLGRKDKANKVATAKTLWVRP
jgi:hypothetical protein